MTSVFLLSILLLNSGVSLALPLDRNARSARSLVHRDSITIVNNSAIAAVTSLSSGQVTALGPFTQFARAAYCDPSTIQDWKCGADWVEACDALPGFEPTLTGGNDNSIQNFFVGFWPDQQTVVVSHEGTDPLALMSDLTDVDALSVPLNSTLFPGVSNDVTVHQGFADEHALTAPQILTAVQQLLAENSAKSVTLIGHSLGGAVAELDCLFMKLNLPADIAIKGVTFGTPRVGNDAFVSLFDSMVTDFQRVNNAKDIVPIVPGRFLGFSHPKGEVHLVSDGDAVACPGNDDATDDQCQIKTVPNIIDGDVLDHLVYNGIHVGTIFCT